MIKLQSAILCLLVTLFGGCSEPHVEAMRIGTNVWAGYEPLYLARELGYFDSDKLRLVEYTSASQVMNAYRNGLLDAAAITLDEAILLLDAGESLHIVLVLDISNGADVLLSQPKIKNISQLRGRRVGVEHTALGAYFISRVIELNKIKANEITVIPIEAHQHERAFRNNKVDAVLTFEPVRSKLLATGANVLFDSSLIPGEIVDVLVVREEKIQQFKPTIEHITKGWYRALENIRKNPEGSSRIMSKRMKLSADEVIKSFAGLELPDKELNRRLLFAEPEPELLGSARRMSEVMFKSKITKQVVDVEKLFWDRMQ